MSRALRGEIRRLLDTTPDARLWWWLPDDGHLRIGVDGDFDGAVRMHVPADVLGFQMAPFPEDGDADDADRWYRLAFERATRAARIYAAGPYRASGWLDHPDRHVGDLVGGPWVETPLAAEEALFAQHPGATIRNRSVLSFEHVAGNRYAARRERWRAESETWHRTGESADGWRIEYERREISWEDWCAREGLDPETGLAPEEMP